MDPARQFSSAEAEAYMSPYFQNVVNAQQRQAIDAARQSQLGGNLAAARGRAHTAVQDKLFFKDNVSQGFALS
jgi:hypothetical protein